MISFFKRFFILLLIFSAFFILVAAVRTYRSGGDVFSMLPTSLQKAKTHRVEAFTPSQESSLHLNDVEMLSRLNEEYARLTKAVVPSVVSIDTVGERTEKLIDFRGGYRFRNYQTQGQGSGVIVSEEGHIITNHHVIAGQNGIQITLHGGKKYNATLIGEDPLLDIAVIKIESQEKFTPLKLGDSSKVEVGQLVFAVGNPFGLGETITQGIISAKERSLSDNQRDLFQTDAAINPGNSGGPLVNLTGEIIGINAAIFSVDRENPSFQGVGFSIPSNDVREALEQIIEVGRPMRGFLGVQMRDLDQSFIQKINYPTTTGSAVLSTTPNSPAEIAGLKTDDVIQSYNEKPIQNTHQLISEVQRSKIGDKVEIGFWRQQKQMKITALIAEAVSAPVIQEGLPKASMKSNMDILLAVGIEVRALSAAEENGGGRGVVVTRILPGGTALGAIFPNDRIIALNNAAVTTPNEFYLQFASSATVQTTTIFLIRNGVAMRLDLLPIP